MLSCLVCALFFSAVLSRIYDPYIYQTDAHNCETRAPSNDWSLNQRMRYQVCLHFREEGVWPSFYIFLFKINFCQLVIRPGRLFMVAFVRLFPWICYPLVWWQGDSFIAPEFRYTPPLPEPRHVACFPNPPLSRDSFVPEMSVRSRGASGPSGLPFFPFWSWRFLG